VYLISVSEDSLLAEVIYKGPYSKFGPNYIEGYVYYKTLHHTPPAPAKVDVKN